VGCADYRLYCDGDSDGDGNDLLHGFLNEETEVSDFRFSILIFGEQINVPPISVLDLLFACLNYYCNN
jgi:hypothetical protein